MNPLDASCIVAFAALTQNPGNSLFGREELHDMSPFASKTAGPAAGDSLNNAGAARREPETFLQEVAALADRLACGVEREEFERHNAAEEKSDTGRNPYRARLLPLFEKIALDGSPAGRRPGDHVWRYPLRAMSAKDIFPARREDCEPDADDKAQGEYAALRRFFEDGLAKIPAAHREVWPLWLDHFDWL